MTTLHGDGTTAANVLVYKLFTYVLIYYLLIYICWWGMLTDQNYMYEHANSTCRRTTLLYTRSPQACIH